MKGVKDNLLCLLTSEAHKNREEWALKPLKHLIDLTVELELNYDMFETADGYDRLNNPALIKTELDRAKLANWAYRVHKELLANRKLTHPDTNLTNVMKEITWILRSCLVSLKHDSHLVRIIAVLWKTVITSVDLELINLNTRLHTYEERIWD